MREGSEDTNKRADQKKRKNFILYLLYIAFPRPPFHLAGWLIWRISKPPKLKTTFLPHGICISPGFAKQLQKNKTKQTPEIIQAQSAQSPRVKDEVTERSSVLFSSSSNATSLIHRSRLLIDSALIRENET